MLEFNNARGKPGSCLLILHLSFLQLTYLSAPTSSPVFPSIQRESTGISCINFHYRN